MLCFQDKNTLSKNNLMTMYYKQLHLKNLTDGLYHVVAQVHFTWSTILMFFYINLLIILCYFMN